MVVVATLYRAGDGTLTFDPSPAYVEELQGILAEGYRLGEGLTGDGESTFVFGGLAEIGMTATEALKRGILLLVE